ncbi:IMP cyclohydrolase [Paenibacillus sp. sptzw28]|uniref:IMP cyclohydrolase n=1 Tax=Paenibacillus sp. sptzw28 TaxID=715179 RepID=UPI001C6E238A|nr:IMP cyclohydrolase [Paenibacillus sp. sptzw28]QYR23500.1 IMP cyclohydrolase [Paenibacillus sp. sptzw28]
MNMNEILQANKEKLQANSYPGRGIIIGMTPSGEHYVQVYWIMGRSENSRNRIFELEGDFVKNKAYDEAKMTDPSLIIYYPLKSTSGMHIITNGDQTDTIYNGLNDNETFESSLFKREYEPDPPHFTPRISGIINTEQRGYKLSILKSAQGRPQVCVRNFYSYNAFIPGEGHCIHTYDGELNGRLISFNGEPFILPLFDGLQEVKEYYWNLLNPANRISLLVKFIRTTDCETSITIVNKNY